METFANRLRRLREARGLTQKNLAHALGVAPTTYREWEYGRVIRGLPYVKLSELFSVSLKELLTGEKPQLAHIALLLDSIERDVKKLKIELESF